MTLVELQVEQKCLEDDLTAIVSDEVTFRTRLDKLSKSTSVREETRWRITLNLNDRLAALAEKKSKTENDIANIKEEIVRAQEAIKIEQARQQKIAERKAAEEARKAVLAEKERKKKIEEEKKRIALEKAANFEKMSIKGRAKVFENETAGQIRSRIALEREALQRFTERSNEKIKILEAALDGKK